MSKVQELKDLLGTSQALADSISQLWSKYNNERQGWLREKQELRNFVYATDTSTTSVNKNSWKNKTTLPKLTQIADNLHANYLSALFPNDNWLRWEGYGREDNLKEKREAIQAYMSNKCRESGFRIVVSELLWDYIVYGNPIADVEWVNDYIEINGERVVKYIGPRAVRISPLDIVFDLTAKSFSDTPKIIRWVKRVGDLKAEAEAMGEEWKAAVAQSENIRARAAQYKIEDWHKASAMQVDGFGSLFEYYGSGLVEGLTFVGSAYDNDTGELLKDHIITVIDRKYVVQKEPIPSWLGDTMVKGGWRKRIDSLMAMGPLDNLVGMQYRIDHLENSKADAWDLQIQPVMKIKGDVEEFTYEPGAEIRVDGDGDVEFMRPDASVLNTNTEINLLEQRMEEYAGAPRQAMGIRTPGEKTAFEVQTLENAAGRIFQEKITSFEIEVLEPLLNSMLEVARRKMDAVDIIRTFDDDAGAEAFLKITKEDITAKGKLRPVGARHFAQKAQLMQNLTGVFNSNLGNLIAPHISSKALADVVMNDILGLKQHDISRPFAALYEQGEQMSVQQAIQEEMVQLNQPTTTVPTDPELDAEDAQEV